MSQRHFAAASSVACIGILAAIGIASCARSQPDARGTSNSINSETAKTKDEPGSQPTSVDRKALDEAVIEAALIDVFTGTDGDSETLRREQGYGKLLFSRTSCEGVGTLNQALGSAEREKWNSMDPADQRATKEAAALVVERVKSKQYFSGFRPKDARIVLWDETNASTQRADRWNRPRPICASPPGYGDQNRLAVVSFSFPWSMHSGDAVYVLRNDGENWRVISRHFLYYL